MKSKDEWQVGDIMMCPDSGTRARRGIEAGMLYCITEFNIGFPKDEAVVRNVITVDANGYGEWWRPSDIEYVCDGGIEELQILSEL